MFNNGWVHILLMVSDASHGQIWSIAKAFDFSVHLNLHYTITGLETRYRTRRDNSIYSIPLRLIGLHFHEDGQGQVRRVIPEDEILLHSCQLYCLQIIKTWYHLIIRS